MKNLALFIAMATLTRAQTPALEKRAKFEVAPVLRQEHDRSKPAANCLWVAGLSNLRGPGWIAAAGFDIDARSDAGEPPREQVLQMVQALLADRFQPALHRETRPLPIYALVVGKTGPRLQAADCNVGRPKTMLGQMVVQKMSMTTLADILAFDLKRPVKDVERGVRLHAGMGSGPG
jgi:hypothetical protein